VDSSGTLATPGMYAIAPKGANWVIDDIWCKHMTMVWGFGTNATIENSRVNNSWGDGMQLNNGEGAGCTNVLIYNNFVRGCGDDAIALTSSSTSQLPVTTGTVKNNTTVASWWANQMGVYGGRNITIASNLFLDSVKKTGIELDAGFGALPPVGQTAINNTLIRCGSYGYGLYQPGIIVLGGGTNTTVANNIISNCMFEGIEIQGVWNLLVQTNLITAPGTTGIIINSGYSGSGIFSYNTVTNLNTGQWAFINSSSGTFAATLVGNIFQSNVSEVVFYQNTQYTGTAGQPLAVGNYTQSQLASNGVPTLWASSVLIPSGQTVIMYTADNFTGTSWTLTTNTPNFTTLSPSANDKMVSCKIQ
jgi:parallel beta-helix repeat protein